MVAISTEKLTKLLDQESRGRQGEKVAKQNKEVVEQSFGVTIALSLKILLAQITHLEEQIQKLDQEIGQRVTFRQTSRVEFVCSHRIAVSGQF